MSTTAETIEATATELGLTMTTVFVPWSQSRNAGEKQPSLNWKVTILRNGREVLTVDYMAGCAHCPSYKQGDNSLSRKEAVHNECEEGFASFVHTLGTTFTRFDRSKPINPELADVLHSLASDAEAIDHATFENWAENYGYDTDSRKAEAIYRACLDTGLKLRAALGEDGLQRLRESCQDY